MLFPELIWEELARLEKLASANFVFFFKEQQRDACENNHENNLGYGTVKTCFLLYPMVL